MSEMKANVGRFLRAATGRLDESVEAVLESPQAKELAIVSGYDCPPICPIFDIEFYLSQVPRAQRGEINAFVDFCGTGGTSGRMPHLLFHPEYIADQIDGDPGNPASLLVALLENTEPPWLSPHPLFDPEIWSATQTVDSRHPMLDFIECNEVVDRPFSPYFDTRFYRSSHPEIGHSRQNPLLHYLDMHGSSDAAGDPNPMIHNTWYEIEYRPVADDPVTDFITRGARGGKLPNPYAVDEIGASFAGMPPDAVESMWLEYVTCANGSADS